MGKTALIFPGQGSQYVGMGKEFYETMPQAKAIYDLSGEVTGLDIRKICFEENDQINQTEYTQIAMFTTELAILKCVESLGIKADICAGLSLGEYAALACAKVLPEQELCALVRKRGKFMQDACPTGGAMTAVLGMDAKVIEEVLATIDGLVSIANYNCPGQIVITGEQTAVDAAAEALKAAGAKRCIPLKVSGPFHSKMLIKAKEQMSEELAKLAFCDPSIPYYTNVCATRITTKENIPSLLADQVVSSVCWMQTMEKMIEEGVDTMIEIGPGRTLSGFMSKINKDIRVFNVDKLADFEKLKEQFS